MQHESTKQLAERDFQLLWIDAAVFTAVCAVLGYILYLFGWSYLYGYFTYFGLSLSEVDLDFREVIVFGVRSALWPRVYVAMGALLTATLVAARLLHKNTKARRAEKSWWFRLVVATCGVGGILSTSLYAQFKGDYDARDIQKNPGCRLATVRVFSSQDKVPAEVGLAAGSGAKEIDGRLLVHGKRGYFVFTPVDVTALDSLQKKLQQPLPDTVNVPLYFIPNESVQAAILSACVDVKELLRKEIKQ